MKKGTDTSIRGQAETLYNANIAYYAQRNALPTGLVSGTYTANGAVVSGVINELASAGELKADFYSLAGSGKLANIIINVPNSESIVVCYAPQSKAFRNDQYTRYNSTARLSTGCPGLAGPISCYQCFK